MTIVLCLVCLNAGVVLGMFLSATVRTMASTAPAKRD